MTVNLEELYKPYAKDASLEQTLDWLKIQAVNLNASPDVMEAAIAETFLEMANGKTFSTDGGDTGFDGKSHAVLNHYLLSKMIALKNEVTKAQTDILSNKINAQIDKRISGARFWNKPLRNPFKRNKESV